MRYDTSPRAPRLSLSLLIVLLFGVTLALACGGETSDAVRIEPAALPAAAATGDARSLAPPPGDRRPTVFIDPGHGGSDPGWGASYIIADMPLEKDLTLDLAKRTAAYLEADGFRVVLSRTTDTDVNRPERDLNADGCTDPIDEVQARMDLANASGAAVLLSIHFNGLPGTSLSGAATFYNAVHEFGEQNKRLAQLIQAAQLEALSSMGHTARDWGALRDDSFDGPTQTKCPSGYRYYTMIGPSAPYRPRPTTMPGAIVEAMFLTHPTEAQLASREDVRDALARAYARAIRQFLEPQRGSAGEPGRTSSASTQPANGGPATPIERGDAGRKAVALTFDAGAETGYAAAILDVLARTKVKGTFGLTGAWAEANPDLTRRIAAEGHMVINHSFSHASWTGRSPGTKPLTAEQRREEVQRTERVLERLTGSSGRPFFRSPYGDRDEGVQRDLGALGYRYNVLWTFDSGAWKGAKAEEIISRGIKAAAPGAIYVFHVAEQQDALALERLIEGIAAAGFTFVTVGELLSAQ